MYVYWCRGGGGKGKTAMTAWMPDWQFADGSKEKGSVRGEEVTVLQVTVTTREASPGFNWLFTWRRGSWWVSRPYPFSPLLFFSPFCLFRKKAVMGHWSGLMVISLLFFLVFLPVFYIKKIPQIILTVEGNWRYHVVNCRADQYNNLIWTHSHFSNEKWNKHLFFFFNSLLCTGTPTLQPPFFLKASQGVQLTAGSSD